MNRAGDTLGLDSMMPPMLFDSESRPVVRTATAVVSAAAVAAN